MNRIQIPYLLISFLLLMGCQWQGKKVAEVFPANSPADSVSFYYHESHNDSLSMARRMELINRSYLLSIEPHPDSVSFISLGYKTYLHKLNNEIDSALLYSHVMLESAKKVNDSAAMGNAYKKLGVYNYSLYRLDSAYFYTFESKKVYEALNDSLSVGKCLLNMAIFSESVGALNQSEQEAVLGLGFLQNTNDSLTKASIYNCLAIISKEQNDFQEALYWYDLAINTTTKQNNANMYLSNSANIYRDVGNYDKAIEILQDIVIKSQSRIHEGSALIERNELVRLKDNLTYTKWLETNNRGYEVSFLEYLDEKIKNRYTSGQFVSHRRLVEFYTDHDKKKAVFHAQKMYDRACDLNHMDYKLEALDQLMQLNKDDPLKFKDLTVRYLKLNDSITDYKNGLSNKFVKIRYDSERNRSDNKILRIENNRRQLALEKSRAMNTIYLLLGFISLLLFAFIYAFLKSRHKKEKLQEIYNTESRISKKVHDEVANDLYQVMTKIETGQDLQNEFIDDLEQIYEKTRDISRENNALDLNQNFDTVLNDLLLSYKNDQLSIITRGLSKINWNSFSNHKKTTLYRVIQELMTNMKKHSHASVVILSFAEIDKKIHVNYKDDGVGCMIKKNNGLLNVENRIESIEGRINFNSEKGKGFLAQITL